MSRVLLVTPYGFQNTGIRLLGAVLRRHGFDASLLFLKGWRNNDVQPPTEREYALLQQHVQRLAPSLIGVGFGSPHLRIVTELTGRIRQVSPAHVVWGGVHPTIVPEDGIEHADSVCVGEGELPLVDLAAALRDGTPVERIPNLWVRLGDSVVRNPPRPLIQALDELPYGELAGGEMAWIDGDRLVRGNPAEDNALYRVFASRGCPFRCAFCYNSQFRQIYAGLGRYHRVRSVANVLDEIVAARRALPALRRVRFDDDTFVFPRPWIEEFCRDYPRRVGLPFDILLNPQAASADALRQLRAAGLVHVQVGIQSGSRRELEGSFERRGDSGRTLELARLLAQLGIEVTYDVILDNPLATAEDHQQLLELLLALPRPYNLFIYSLTVFPRSAIARQLLDAGLIREDQIEGRANKSHRQFRLTLDYPRPAEEAFFAALVSLCSKGFIPRAAIRALSRSGYLRRHPAGLRVVAEAANAAKLGQVAWGMLRRRELSMFKLAEYASFRRRIIQ